MLQEKGEWVYLLYILFEERNDKETLHSPIFVMKCSISPGSLHIQTKWTRLSVSWEYFCTSDIAGVTPIPLATAIRLGLSIPTGTMHFPHEYRTHIIKSKIITTMLIWRGEGRKEGSHYISSSMSWSCNLIHQSCRPISNLGDTNGRMTRFV